MTFGDQFTDAEPSNWGFLDHGLDVFGGYRMKKRQRNKKLAHGMGTIVGI